MTFSQFFFCATILLGATGHRYRRARMKNGHIVSFFKHSSVTHHWKDNLM